MALDPCSAELPPGSPPFTPRERFILEHLDDPDLEDKLQRREWAAESSKVKRQYSTKLECGTRNKYFNAGCRCQLCLDAAKEYKRSRREALMDAP